MGFGVPGGGSELRTPNSEPRTAPVRIIRWRGLIPATLALVALALGWLLFGERIVKNAIEEAGSKALGAALDVASVDIQERRAAVELRGLTLADPFDRNRNLVDAGLVRVELEPEPLLERKIVVRRLTVGDVRTGTPRASPARPIAGGGFAPRALAELDRWSKQFKVPLLSLTPIDTIKAVVLDPTQLRTVREALAVARRADSVKLAVEEGYTALRLRETLDTARALVTRLQGTNLRALGVAGARTAVADVKRAAAQIDSAKRRVETLERSARGGVDALQAGLRSIDDARREDYEFARGLLKLPSFEAPQIGAALFGRVTIEKFEQALYWTTLAREYAPPGLLPRESAGPKRLRRSGSTVHFVKREAYPRFLLQRADIDMTVGLSNAARGTYSIAVTDVTTEPAAIGRPARFALRRDASGSGVESLRVTGLLDHAGARPRDAVAAQAAGVRLPVFPLPALPFRAQPGRGTSELHLVLEGDQVSARWTLRSGELVWLTDSARARQLNTVESLVARVITGVRDFDLTAELTGPVRAPALAVRSNLDRAVATRLKEVAGEEVERAMAKARAQVDRIVDEKTAPIKARITELRADAERRVADAKARLDEERQKLDTQLKALVLRL
ncbi:MAG: hypothetical protein M3282_12100 [Gemmatimonadota bacterium]|nr:hypothetical protein [Gemmatimonadota bacterium]